MTATGAIARSSPKPVPPCPASNRNAASRKARPNWVMARYQMPARRVSGSSDSVMTSK